VIAIIGIDAVNGGPVDAALETIEATACSVNIMEELRSSSENLVSQNI